MNGFEPRLTGMVLALVVALLATLSVEVTRVEAGKPPGPALSVPGSVCTSQSFPVSGTGFKRSDEVYFTYNPTPNDLEPWLAVTQSDTSGNLSTFVRSPADPGFYELIAFRYVGRRLAEVTRVLVSAGPC